MAAKRGLGKGLSTMIDSLNTVHENVVSSLNIIDVEPNPDQPRKEFDKEKLEALKSSIEEIGVILPIIVTKKDNGRYQIIAGERRWRASKLAGLKTIPAIVKDYKEKEAAEIALIENLQREDLNPIEEAKAAAFSMAVLARGLMLCPEKKGEPVPFCSMSIRRSTERLMPRFSSIRAPRLSLSASIPSSRCSVPT